MQQARINYIIPSPKDTNKYKKNNEMYQAFTKYFNNPTLVKIKNITDCGAGVCLYVGMYMVKIQSGLGTKQRYLISLVPNDAHNPEGTEQTLEKLKWKSLQTRTTDEIFPVLKGKTSAHYLPTRLPELNKPIKAVNRETESVTYKCEDFPMLQIVLLCDTQDIIKYQTEGSIPAALETYQTLINLVI